MMTVAVNQTWRERARRKIELRVTNVDATHVTALRMTDKLGVRLPEPRPVRITISRWQRAYDYLAD
jgi:hypothetical protein